MPAPRIYVKDVKLHEVDLPSETIARARRGERDALGAFYGACAAQAYTLIRRLVPVSAADDLLQEAFLDAIRALPRFAGEAPIGAWFRRIVVNRCYQHLRSPWHRSRDWFADLVESVDRAAPVAPAPGLAIDLERALQRLSPAARLVVWLHDVEGYTHEEIGAVTDRTPSFSKSQLARAHARLRMLLSPPPTDIERGAPLQGEVP